MQKLDLVGLIVDKSGLERTSLAFPSMLICLEFSSASHHFIASK